MANELITNAVKYAYQDNQRGTVWVRVARGADDTIELSVRDEGGAPDGFRASAPHRGLGCASCALSRQLMLRSRCAALTPHRIRRDCLVNRRRNFASRASPAVKCSFPKRADAKTCSNRRRQAAFRSTRIKPAE